MLRRRALAALLAGGLAATAAVALAVPVLAQCNPATGTCITPGSGGSTTITAVAGLPPQAGPNTSGGTSWTSAAVPSCPPTSAFEPVGGGPGVYGWADPSGINHLAHGSPPSPGGWLLAEYWVSAVYSRSMSPTCQPGPWIFKGYVASPIAFPTPTASTPGVAQAVAGLRAEAAQNMTGGQLETSPPSNALVNLATYFWITGSTTPTDLLTTTTVPGPTEEGGRHLQLTVALEVARTGTTYFWGDGQSTLISEPDSLGAPGTSGSVIHTYHDVSVPGEKPSPYPLVSPQGFITVSSTQELQASAWEIWIDASGRHQISLGQFNFSVPVSGSQLRVGQIEGVPFCPSTKSCS